jgi:hypothetical protein
VGLDPVGAEAAKVAKVAKVDEVVSYET